MQARPFPTVLLDELSQIEARRHRQERGLPPQHGPLAPPELDAALRQARACNLVGLAFSGGGIRSATFNLGVLQGLAKLRLLPFIDYLSTVSGGGYIGSWFAACILRSAAHGGTGDGLCAVQETLRTDQPAPQPTPGRASGSPCQHLRDYSNYLTPRRGLFSPDTWALAAGYLRNALLNQLVLVPLLLALLILPRLVMLVYLKEQMDEDAAKRLLDKAGYWLLDLSHVWALPVLGGATLVSLVTMFVAVTRVRSAAVPLPALPVQRARTWVVNCLIVLPLVVAAVALGKLATFPRQDLEVPFLPDHQNVAELVWFAATFGALVAVGFLLAQLPRWRIVWKRLWAVLDAGWRSVVAGGLAGCLCYGVYRLLHHLYFYHDLLARDYVRVRVTAAIATVGPPLVLVAAAAGIFLGVGLLGPTLREELREWWSQVCGRLLVAAIAWLTFFAVALYGTVLVLRAEPWVQALLASGWIATTAAGVAAGRSPATGARGNGSRLLEAIALIGPHAFIAGLLIAGSVVIHLVVDHPPAWQAAPETIWHRDTRPVLPAWHVTTTKGTDGKPEARTDTATRTEVADETEVIGEMYWAGMVNASGNFVPREQYVLDDDSFHLLEREQVHKEVRQALEPLRYVPHPHREDFDADLARVLPGWTSYRDRLVIIQQAKKVVSFKFLFWETLKVNAIALGVLLTVACFAGFLTNVNLFSLHGVYSNRLIRCYLGASHLGRDPDPITLFDPDDGVDLAQLQIGPDGDSYNGPLLLVNTALNLVHGDRLDWQERKAESFVLTPLYCGSEDTGYRPTAPGWDANCPDAAYAGGLKLGQAVTISGAAASPNMGYHSSPAVTFLLTLFNARLGAWLGNPRYDSFWDRDGPWEGYLYLFRELFGWTQADGDYVYLSDGGHFENLGVYELVRRRCRFVILSDAGCDGAHGFEDLGNLIRKVRIDFGIRIEIDLGAVRKAADARESRWHCAVGKIRYDDVDCYAAPGTLVYLKPSLTGDEPADVRHYADSHPSFPHETTANQFYNESQFESYRELGRHVALAVFEQAHYDMREDQAPNNETAAARHRRQCRMLFAAVERRWFAMPPDYEATFLHSTHDFMAVQETLRKDPRLWRLTADLYPELDPKGDRAAAIPGESDTERLQRECAEVHAIIEMLQAMQTAWLSLNLEACYAHPYNRGWMGIFHRWSNAPTVRRHWPMLRSEFSREFVTFCEKQMLLGVVKGVATPVRDRRQLGEEMERFFTEFEDQWPLHPEQGPAGPDLRKRVGQIRSCVESKDQAVLVWRIDPDGSYPPAQGADVFGHLPYGLITVTQTAGGGNGKPEYELFVWMRGPYRNSGLGRFAVDSVLDQLRGLFNGRGYRLRVTLPTGHLTGAGGKLQKAMWLTFFSHHEFMRVGTGQDDANGKETILEREFGE